MLQTKFFVLLGTAMLIKKHNKQEPYKAMLILKEYNKFSPLKIWACIERSQTRVKPTIIRAVETVCAQKTPSDEQRPFYCPSSRMERKHDTLGIKPAFKLRFTALLQQLQKHWKYSSK